MAKFDQYFLMGIEDILEYTLLKLPDLGWDKSSMQAKEIGDGNLNYVFRVWDGAGHSVIIKHAGVSLRISKDEKGREYFSYINRMTLGKFQKILGDLHIRPAFYREVPLRPWLKPLARLPVIKEMFVKMAVCIIEKQPCAAETRA